MVLYEVSPSPMDAQPEGESNDEYYTSRRSAMRRVEEIVTERLADPHDYAWCGVTVTKLAVRDLPRTKLALAILNRRGWVETSEKMLDYGPEWFRDEAKRRGVPPLD